MIEIIQITDHHLYNSSEKSYRGVFPNKNYETLIQNISSQLAQCDLIISTGDISNDETLESYELFLASLKRYHSKLFWMPGNHDDKSLMIKAQLNMNPIISPLSQTRGNWLFLLIETHKPGEIPGWFNEENLKFLNQELKKYPDKNVLIALHHHPIPVDGHMDKYIIQNPEAFFSIIDTFDNVKVVIGGHVHQKFETTRKGVKYLYSPSTSYQIQPQLKKSVIENIGPGYRRIRLHNNGIVETEVKYIE